MTGSAQNQQSHGGNTDTRDLLSGQAVLLRERPHELIRNLSAYVTYELGRRVRMGQIDYEDLLRDEVIDTVFAAALTRIEQGQPVKDLPNYLRSRAQDFISKEVRRIQQERRQHVSLEQTISPGDDSEGGEEVRIVDIIADPNARDPDEAVIDAETLSFMVDALADVPDLWRTVFLQRTIQERSAREIAEIEGLDLDEVRRITILTRDFLRGRFEQEFEFLDVDD